jgi:hypothetical protein
MRALETKDIVSLLRSEIKRAGSVSAWSRKVSLDRTVVSKVLNNQKPPTRSIIKALKLRIVVVADD